MVKKFVTADTLPSPAPEPEVTNESFLLAIAEKIEDQITRKMELNARVSASEAFQQAVAKDGYSKIQYKNLDEIIPGEEKIALKDIFNPLIEIRLPKFEEDSYKLFFFTEKTGPEKIQDYEGFKKIEKICTDKGVSLGITQREEWEHDAVGSAAISSFVQENSLVIDLTPKARPLKM